MPNAAAAEFAKLEIPFRRLTEEVFDLPVVCEAGHVVARIRLTPQELGLVAPQLMSIELKKEYEAVAMLNYYVVTFGRLGVDPADGELRFDAQQLAPTVPDVVVAYARASHHVPLALEVMQRVRFGGLSPLAALEAAQSNAAHSLALAVAQAAWEGSASD